MPHYLMWAGLMLVLVSLAVSVQLWRSDRTRSGRSLARLQINVSLSLAIMIGIMPSLLGVANEAISIIAFLISMALSGMALFMLFRHRPL